MGRRCETGEGWGNEVGGGRSGTLEVEESERSAVDERGMWKGREEGIRKGSERKGEI